MVNFLALMSFSMPEGREEFTLAEFVDAFDLTRISLGGPVFDLEKLTWLNGRYLRRLSTGEMIERLRGHLLSDAYLAQVIPLCRERVDTLEGFFDYASFFFVGEVDYDAPALAAMVPGGRTPAQVAKTLRALLEGYVDGELEWSAERLEAGLKAFAEAQGWVAKELFMTVRLAATGRAATPPLFETLAVLGKEVSRRRLRRAAEALS
jgi:glutamyl-tRNA synthetase